MSALKWGMVGLFGLGSAGALGMAFTADTRRPVTERRAPPVALRPFPGMTGLGAAKAEPPKPSEVAKAPEPKEEPAKPAEVAKAPEPKAEPAKPAEVAKAEPAKAPPAKPAEAKAEPAKAPEPKAEPAKPAEVAQAPEPKDEPEAPKAEPAKPAPVAARPAAPPPAEKPAAAPPAEGTLNLRATDTADVYLDGKKLGGSPLLGVKAKAGSHKVRFDCYDAAGNTVAGPAQAVTVKADAETDIEFTCPAE